MDDTEQKTIAQMTAEVVENNTAKGWYVKDVPFPEAMALLHSEVSEALEAWRKWGLADATRQGYLPLEPSKPQGAGSEFADIFIRLLDYSHRFGIDLMTEYERKMKFNRTREYRHGNKRI